MFEVRNYCTHALESLDGALKKLKAYTHWDTSLDQAAYAAVMKDLQGAAKFSLPANGVLMDSHIDDKVLELFRLPYKGVALEYPLFNRGTSSGHRLTRMIALCGETSYEGTEGVSVVSLAYFEQMKSWELSPVALFLEYGLTLSSEPFTVHEKALSLLNIEAEKMYASMDGKNQPTFRVSSIPLLPFLLGRGAESFGVSTEEYQASLSYASFNEVDTLLHFCAVMNCSNVETATIPPNAKLNKRRVKNGQYPFYEYKTLVLDSGKSAEHEHTGVRIIGRQSPRQHLRRGHIRKYQTGKTVWINSVLVGDPSHGKIDKEYKVGVKHGSSGSSG